MSTRTEYPDSVEWLNEQGLLHRLEGPSIEWKDGDKEWFINGKRHREDGPAVEYSNGNKYWYLNGQIYSKKYFKKELIKIKLKRIQNL